MPPINTSLWLYDYLATGVKVNGQGDFLGKVKDQRQQLEVKILDLGRGRKNRVYGSDTLLKR